MLAICSKHDDLRVHHAGPRQSWSSDPTILSSSIAHSFVICRFMHDHDLLAAVGTSTTTNQACLLVFRISTASLLFHIQTQSNPAAVHDIYPRISISNPYDPQLHVPFPRILTSAYPNAADLFNLKLQPSHSLDVNKSQSSSLSPSTPRQSAKQPTPQFHLCREPSLVVNRRPPSPPSSMIKSSDSSTRTPLHSRFRNWVTDLQDKGSSQNASPSGIRWRNQQASGNQPPTSVPDHVDDNRPKAVAQCSEKLVPPVTLTPHAVLPPKQKAAERSAIDVSQASPQPSSSTKSLREKEDNENPKKLHTEKTLPTPKQQSKPTLLNSKDSNKQRENTPATAAHDEQKLIGEKKTGTDETLSRNKGGPHQVQGALTQDLMERDEVSSRVINTSGTDGCCKDKPRSDTKTAKVTSKNNATPQSQESTHGTTNGCQEKHCDNPKKKKIDSNTLNKPQDLKCVQPGQSGTRQVINGSSSVPKEPECRGELGKPSEKQRVQSEPISVLDSPDSIDWTPATRYAVREQNKRGIAKSHAPDSSKKDPASDESTMHAPDAGAPTKSVAGCTNPNHESQTKVCTNLATEQDGSRSSSNSGTGVSDPVPKNTPTVNANVKLGRQASQITAVQDLVNNCKNGSKAATAKAADGSKNIQARERPTGLAHDALRSHEIAGGKVEKVEAARATVGIIEVESLKQGAFRKEDGLPAKSGVSPECKQELVMDRTRPKLDLNTTHNSKQKTEEKIQGSAPMEILERCKHVFARALQNGGATERYTLTNQRAYTTMLSFAQKEGVYTDKRSMARIIYETVGIKNSCTLEMFVDSFMQIFARSRALRKQRWTTVFSAVICDEGESILVFHARDLMKAEVNEGRIHLDDRWTDGAIESVFERVSDGILVDLQSFLRGVDEILDC